MQKKQSETCQPGYISSKYLKYVIQNEDNMLYEQYISTKLPIKQSYANLDIDILEGREENQFQEDQYQLNTVIKYKPKYKQQQSLAKIEQQAKNIATSFFKKMGLQQYIIAEIRYFTVTENYQQKLIFYHDFYLNSDNHTSKKIESDSNFSLQKLLNPPFLEDTISTSIDPELSFHEIDENYSQYTKKIRIFIKEFILVRLSENYNSLLVIYQFQQTLQSIQVQVNIQQEIKPDQEYRKFGINLREMLFEYIVLIILNEHKIYYQKPQQCYYNQKEWYYCLPQCKVQPQTINIKTTKNQKNQSYGVNISKFLKIAQIFNLTISELSQQNLIIESIAEVKIQDQLVIILDIKFCKKLSFQQASPKNTINQLFKLLDLLHNNNIDFHYICQVLPNENNQNEIKLCKYSKFLEIDQQGSQKNMIKFLLELFN